jgi:hypothetical protein
LPERDTHTPRDSRTPVELVAEADHGARVDPPRLSFPAPGAARGHPRRRGRGCLPVGGEDIPHNLS